jgi:replication factor A1
MTLNPDIPEAHMLRGWFDTIGQNTDAQSISQVGGQSGGVGGGSAERKLISQIKDENLGMGDKVKVDVDIFLITA